MSKKYICKYFSSLSENKMYLLLLHLWKESPSQKQENLLDYVIVREHSVSF